MLPILETEREGGAERGVAIAIIALFFVACCYLPLRMVLEDAVFVTDLWDAVVYVVIGWCSLSLYSLILLRFGITSNAYLVILPVVVLLYGWWRRRGFVRYLPLPVSVRIDWVGSGCSAVALVLFVHLAVAQAFVMGKGDSPAYFFNTDTPYYLEHVFSLLRAKAYPPESLSNVGYLASYHYGVQNMAALLSRLAGLPPHKSLFWVLVPFLMMATFAAAMRLGKSVASGYPLPLFALIVLCCPVLPAVIWSGLTSLLKTGNTFKLFSAWLDPQLFGNGFPMLSTQMATILFLTILWCLQGFDRFNARLLYVLSLVLLLVTKSAWFVSAGCGVFGVSIYRVLRYRDYSCGLYSFVALSLSVAVFIALPSAEGRELAFGLGYYFSFLDNPRYVSVYPHVFELDRVLDGALVFGKCFAVPLLVVACLLWRKRKLPVPWEMMLIYLTMFAAPLVFVNIVVLKDLRADDVVTLNADLGQVCSSLSISAGTLVAVMISALYAGGNKRLRLSPYIVTLVVLALPLFHLMFQTYRYARNIEYGHEYANNIAIAEVLRAVPVEGALLVTNDLRYQTGSGTRNLMQPQIPALFGHQCYACNLKYQIFHETSMRYKQQQWLALDTWFPLLDRLIIKYGWTHLLIHKEINHPDNIPYPLLKENKYYAVYELQSERGNFSEGKP